jgi:hypothetical protein
MGQLFVGLALLLRASWRRRSSIGYAIGYAMGRFVRLMSGIVPWSMLGIFWLWLGISLIATVVAIAVASLPIILLYFFAQRTFIEGISMTGVKG